MNRHHFLTIKYPFLTLSLALITISGNTYAQEPASQDFETAWDDAWETEADLPTQQWLHGFIEHASGTRITSTDENASTSLLDTRARLEASHTLNRWSLNAKGDLYYDGVLKDWQNQMRELSAQRSFNRFDIKIGRQILTWGTGDYLFLNDFFPKDWQSFFAGRHDEYLKSPSDAIKISHFTNVANIDVVWTPEFDPDNYINGDYFSFFDRTQNRIAAPAFSADTPQGDEWAIRLYKNRGSNELAVYGYDGYFKSPNAINSQGQYTFSRLQSLGASWRRPLGKGLFNAETAYYDSLDDKHGENPAISNSQWRLLFVYEQELITRLTGSTQCYLEHTLNHSALIAHSPTPQLEPEENRTVITTRLTWRNPNDKLTLSLFMFYSPTDRDSYWRPSATYRFNDQWQLSGGMNGFSGNTQHTFFNQFQENNNLYVRVRLSF